MGKFIVIVIIAFAGFAWYKGWLGQWFDSAVDSSMEGVKGTRSKATTLRPADQPEPKK
jgi:hypothetical protein